MYNASQNLGYIFFRVQGGKGIDKGVKVWYTFTKVKLKYRKHKYAS